MKNSKQPLQVRTTPLFHFERSTSNLPDTTHPTTVTSTTSVTGILLTNNNPVLNKTGN